MSQSIVVASAQGIVVKLQTDTVKRIKIFPYYQIFIIINIIIIYKHLLIITGTRDMYTNTFPEILHIWFQNVCGVFRCFERDGDFDGHRGRGGTLPQIRRSFLLGLRHCSALPEDRHEPDKDRVGAATTCCSPNCVLVIVNKLICRYVVGKGGRYVVGTWSLCGRYVVGMWLVRGRYVVGKGGRYVVGTWSVCGRYVVGTWLVRGR